MALHQHVHQHAFARIGGGQRHVAAFAGNRHPAARAIGQQARHAQAGAGPEQAQRRTRHGRTTTHLPQVFCRQVRQRQRQRGEVVEHAQRAQAEFVAQGGLRERPVVVGHGDPVTGDRVGHGDGRQRRLAAQAVQVHADRRLQAGVVGHRQHLDVFDGGAGPGLPGQPRIGATDIGQQAACVRR